jgi:hypothetical protein
VTRGRNKLECLSVEIIFKFAKSSILKNTPTCYVLVKVFKIIARSVVHVVNFLIALLIVWHKEARVFVKDKYF